MEQARSGLYIENDRLFDYAAASARLLTPVRACSGRRAAARLRRCMEELRRIHEAVDRRYGQLPSPPAACEWLLDNWYMAQREYAAAASALRAAGQLRWCREEPLILRLAGQLLEAGQGAVTEERCRLFLDGFQTVTVLRRGELDLFPAAVRAAALENIARVCRSMQYAADTAEHAAALEALFTTLRLFSVLDLERLLNAADVTGAVLAADPTGDYARMDSATRRSYLRRVEQLARREGIEEHVLARRLVQNARAKGEHIGFALFSQPSPLGGRLYIAANLLATLFISLLLAFAFESALAALLLLLPVSELVKSLLDFVLLRLVPPKRLPRMDTEDGVPPEGRTVCVISALLTGPEAAETCSRRLEELRQVCKSEGPNLLFGLLADLPEADTETTEADEVTLRAARSGVAALNRKYGGGFYLFERPRVPAVDRWSGWERKRGAITELARLLCGQDNALRVTGERDALKDVRYILTLDGDTRVYPGAAGELIGAMLHPLNRPVVDGQRRVVTRGHAVIHPRMDTELFSANATDFALIFAGAGGCDPYGGLCGELYMDAFGNGGFAGKGILDARVFLSCTEGRFPEGHILSHDALEGACLRGAFMGDTEFSDSFPARPLSYYKRLHRWIRGDWQNLPWVFCRDFTDLDRWRLFDSLRRSLLAPLTLAAILSGFFLPGRGLAVAAWAALLALLSRLLLALAESSVRRREKVRLRRTTRLLTGVGGSIVQTFIRLWLLPYEAWVSLSAIGTSLWRMLVSHKRLLQWQTAAQSEGGSLGLWAHIRAMWFPMLLGLGLLLFSPAIIGRSAGLMWLLSPLAAAALALPAYKEDPLSAVDRDYLRKAAGANYRYLQKLCTREDNFLPPDNFQEQPPTGAAHRTSPTNIGLALVSAVAAMDMELIRAPEALERIRRIVSTLERMPRHLGHYYNWYDTRTLAPLSPAYISTVDSGNLCACLITVRQAVAELDPALAERLRAIEAPMRFTPLYDRERNLFYICYDVSRDRGAGGWYDLMASEAMLTSYLAVARGDVPVKHWRRLSRAQLQKDGYRGLASWTGTMFEYLMPALFLPLYRGSLLYESGRFCLYVQKHRTAPGKPWGVSESAFYSLDPSLSYRYKANGCAALALKRGQDADLVISPYSSFLALAVDPQGAVRNLRRLERLGAWNRFGFIEAVDFTPSRCRSGQGEKVRCTMAHHVGMSVLAAANAVCGGSIRQRFLSDPAMGSASLLLQERLPADGVVLRRDLAEPGDKPPRSTGRLWQRRGGPEDPEPRRCLLSNGAYNIMSTNQGHSAASLRDMAVYGDPYALEQSSPVLELKAEGGRSLRFPCPRPALWELGEDEARCAASLEGIDCSVSLWAAGGDLGELREIRLCCTEDRQLQLSLSFVPLLARPEDYRSHPAFWALGLWAEQTDNALLLRRLPRGSTPELWLCLACGGPARYEGQPGQREGWLSAPKVTARLDLSLRAGDEETVRFALCLGRSREAALEGAGRILHMPGKGNMAGAAAAHLGMSAQETDAAMALLDRLYRPLAGAVPRRDLWPYGVSGDLPLLCCDGRALELLPLLRQYCLLKSCGAELELVIFSDEQGEYHSPVYRRVSEALAQVGLEPLIGSRGGVHFVPLAAADTFAGRASVCIGRETPAAEPLPLPDLSLPRSPGSVPLHAWNRECFEFYVNSSLPPRAWQQLLTNGRFGAIVTETGPAGMWLTYARELRVTKAPSPWQALGRERIWTEKGGQCVSLFAADDGLPCRVRYGPGWAVWEKDLGGRTIRSTAFIPSGLDARVLLIQGAAGLRLHWALEPVLSGGDASSLRCRFEGGIFRAENPESCLPGTELLAACGLPCSCRTDFSPAAMLLSLAADESLVLACGCCTEEEIIKLCKPEWAEAALEETRRRWLRILARLELRSGDASLDHYLRFWAAYQSIACRLVGRSSLYQDGGAYGFRDQLQDAVNLLLLTPRYAKEQILLCCAHQYVEGDVMHWWHPLPEGDRGIRSRCSDDLLWLPWALCEYVDATGDTDLCAAEVPYISSPPLREGERDRYETPEPSGASASVLFHARAALDCCIARGFGPHGLPFMGSGDWNDGLDRSGGESVWLGWFFAGCASRFAGLLQMLCKPNASRYADYARRVGQAADAAWNGRWYRRGYTPQGEPLGGDSRIDSLPQSWAAMSPFAAPERAARGLDEALRRLLDERQGLVRLFDPPFSPDETFDPGYIVSYGEGFRENGGQYTHAALWLAMALLEQARPDDAWAVLRLLLPENHDLGRYQAEPFVLAADVYTAPGHEGEAGWTWYTGSAAWFFRVAAREMLGLKLRDGRLTVEPRLPAALPGYRARWTDGAGAVHEITVQEGEIWVDGEKYAGNPIGDPK